MNLPIVYGSDKNEFDLNKIKCECDLVKAWLTRYEDDKPVVERECQKVNMDLIAEQVVLSARNEELVLAIQEAMLKSKDEGIRRAAEANPDIFNSKANKAKVNGKTPKGKPKKKVEKLCTKLYKKIAMKTHPDRIGKNEYLNAMFLAAHAAYQEWDYDALRLIWKELNDKKGRAEALTQMAKREANLTVDERITLEEKRLEELQAKQKKIMADFFSQVVHVFWEKGIEFAIAYHAQCLQQSIAEFSMLNPQLEIRLKKALGEYDEFMLDPEQSRFKE